MLLGYVWAEGYPPAMRLAFIFDVLMCLAGTVTVSSSGVASNSRHSQMANFSLNADAIWRRYAAGLAPVNFDVRLCRMPLLSRLKVSFAMVVLAIGVLVVLDMLVAWNIGHIIFSPWFVVPAYAIAYVLAPAVSKRFPLGRSEAAVEPLMWKRRARLKGRTTPREAAAAETSADGSRAMHGHRPNFFIERGRHLASAARPG